VNIQRKLVFAHEHAFGVALLVTAAAIIWFMLV